MVPGMVRVSFGLYNTHDDIDRLIEALTAIARNEYGAYEAHPVIGSYAPAHSTDNFSGYFKI